MSLAVPWPGLLVISLRRSSRSFDKVVNSPWPIYLAGRAARGLIHPRRGEKGNRRADIGLDHGRARPFIFAILTGRLIAGELAPGSLNSCPDPRVEYRCYCFLSLPLGFPACTKATCSCRSFSDRAFTSVYCATKGNAKSIAPTIELFSPSSNPHFSPVFSLRYSIREIFIKPPMFLSLP